VSGEEAIQALGADAARVAAENGMSVQRLFSLLRTDDSLWLRDGELFFVDSVRPLEDEEPVPEPKEAVTMQEAFTLHSLPGAQRVIFLDFDGHHSVNNSWGHNIMFPAYDTNGDSTTFSSAELTAIEAQWKRAAEDFSPFFVDVTTEEPPAGGLTKNGAGDTTWGVRCIMTQATAGFGSGIGGIAFVNSFDDSIDNPVFAFNKGYNNGSMTASHEVGHSLGLSHDGLNSQQYHPGVAGNSNPTSWGPIMGAPFGKSLVQWSNGDYVGATNTENDVNIITKAANGVTTKVDDYPDAVPSTGAPLSFDCPDPSTAVVAGIIETRTDVDTFLFDTKGGPVTIDAVPHPGGPNVDILLELYDDTGMLVASDNRSGQITASIAMSLPAGEYTILIDGTEKLPRYSDYGCIGTYTITVTRQLWANLGQGSGAVLVGTGFACPFDPVELALTGAPPESTVFLAYGWERLDAPFHGGVLVPDVAGFGSVTAVRTDAAGSASISRLWPTGMPAGTRVAYQF